MSEFYKVCIRQIKGKHENNLGRDKIFINTEPWWDLVSHLKIWNLVRDNKFGLKGEQKHWHVWGLFLSWVKNNSIPALRLAKLHSSILLGKFKIPATLLCSQPLTSNPGIYALLTSLAGWVSVNNHGVFWVKEHEKKHFWRALYGPWL